MVVENKMREIILEKVTVNINVGNDRVGMERAKKLLQKITNRTPVPNKAKRRIATWSIRPGLAIGYKVTLRGKEAIKFLDWILKSKGNIIKESSLNEYGNFSIGVAEYLDLIGIKYDAEIGVLGFEVSVTFARRGNRVKYRFFRPGKIPKRHRTTKEEVKKYLLDKFNVKFV